VAELKELILIQVLKHLVYRT